MCILPCGDRATSSTPAARKLLAALAQHAPARFTWGQAATLAGLKPSGGHFNAGRKALPDASFIDETGDLVSVTPAGLGVAGKLPPAPSTPAERLAMWCGRLPSPAPETLRTLAAKGERSPRRTSSRPRSARNRPVAPELRDRTARQ